MEYFHEVECTGWPDLPGHDDKLTPDMKLILNSYKVLRVQTEVVLVIFLPATKFGIVCVGLILGKVGIDRFTGPRGEIKVRYELNFKLTLTIVGCK